MTPLDHAALMRELAARGEVEECPACGEGYVSPELAAAVRAVLPPAPADEPTLDEIPAVVLGDDEEPR